MIGIDRCKSRPPPAWDRTLPLIPRNRTFLKRKGGLFKKAHELSVLCSVEVAVVIFGHNKKLYEYSSGDINETIGRHQYVRGIYGATCGAWTNMHRQYGVAHEHKGPTDFTGRGDNDDDDEDDMATPPPDDPMLHEQSLPPHIQSNFAHVRHAPSASPPMATGAHFHHRVGTPPMQMGSRPGSRNGVRRPSSLSQPPQQASQAPSGPNGYAYLPNQPVYHPHASQGMPTPPLHAPAPQQSQFYHQGQPPQHPQVQQFTQEARRQSMPPTFPQREQAPRPPQVPSPPEPVKREEPPEEGASNNSLKPVQTTKSRSIFTPIDDSRSLLAQHWSRPTSGAHKPGKDNRSQSIDVGSVQRANAGEPAPPPPRPQKTQPQQDQPEFPPPSRTNSISQGSGKRPQLKVQIPAEQSEDEEEAEGSAEESVRRSSGGGENHAPGGEKRGSNSNSNSNETNHSGVVLPPPSPSASAILSAGATGPPNPFARPPPPSSMTSGGQNNNERPFGGNSNNNNIETPISALPSRVMDNQLLPSPSSFYPDWGFGRGGGDGNMLPSPLNFQTPVVANGQGFGGREDDGLGDKKRKSPDMIGSSETGSDGNGDAKRIKTGA